MAEPPAGPDREDPGGAALEAGQRRARETGQEHALSVLEFPRVLELVAGHATSSQGAEHLRGLRPSADRDVVEERLGAADEMTGFLHHSEGWAPPPVPEVRGALRRLAVEGTVLEGAELRGLARLLASSRSARRAILQDEDRFPRLARRAEDLLAKKELREELERSIDEGGALTDEASGELGRIRRRLRAARSDLKGSLESFARDLPGRIQVADASVTVRSGRYCVPIRRDGRSEVGGIVHDESSTGQTLFVEPPFAIEPMNELRELEAEEDREERRILEELTGKVRPLAASAARSLDVLVELDSLFARARYALSHGGERPELGDGDGRGPYRVVEGYHPLLLAAEESAVPFGLRLAGDERVLLVSGPNAGGKTVLLKTVGLHSMMAQSGIVPPVGRDTRLPFYRGFFAVIGDEQSIEASLSTFSAQVGSLRRILDESGPATLVLLDEVGSHTDPAEGAALASAVLTRLAEQAGLTVATTHLGELKALAGEDRRVVNASLQFDAERLRPTYRLRRDRPGRSYALEIAQRLGLDPDVLEEARARLGASEQRMESVLADLERKEERLEELTREVEARREEVAELEEGLERQSDRLERREREVEEAARSRVEEYLLEARSEVEEVVERLEEELRAAGGEREREEAASRARSRVEEAVREARSGTPRGPSPSAGDREPPELSAGDRVRMRSTGREGRVLEVREDEAVVAAGQVRLTVPPRSLEKVAGDEGDGGSGTDGPARTTAERRPDLTARGEVDLRGLRVAEVEAELVPALDAAVVADLPRFRVIHGKGTGALRQRVRELLGDDPRVASVRDGEAGEGGRGVTVVEFE